MKYLILTIYISTLATGTLYAQLTPPRGEDSLIAGAISVRYTELLKARAEKLGQQLEKKTKKALEQIKKEEEKLRKKLQQKDSLAAVTVFAGAATKYKELEQRLQNTSLKQYLPRLDSLSASLKFLQQNPELLSQAREAKEKLDDALAKVKGLENQFQRADEIKRFLKERKQFLKEQLGKLGFAKELKKLNKQVYYYAETLKEIKNTLQDSKKLESKALEVLSKTKLFQSFFKKNSMLASLFPMPGSGINGPAAQTGFAGLQTRSQVIIFIQNQSGTNTPGFASTLQQNIQNTQGIIDQLRNKLSALGGSGDDLEMPDFKPNNQRTKSFKQRLEIGVNLQTQKSNFYFPNTTDAGLSVGYKLNDKSIVGVGTSLKVGLGKNIQHMKISGEGVSIRSFMELKIKNSFYASGGFEYNYQQAFTEIRSLYNLPAWKKSALLGISKIVSFKGSFLKKLKIQLLYDFLYKEKLPVTTPLKFRFGYFF